MRENIIKRILTVKNALWAFAAVLIITGVTFEIKQQQDRAAQAEQRADEANKGRESAEKARDDAEADRDAKARENAEKQRQIDDLNKQLQAKRDAQSMIAAKPPSTSPALSGVAEVGDQAGSTVYAVGCSIYEPLVRQYEWNVPTMMRIMDAESDCNPNKHNYGDNHGSCLGSYGLFQIGCIHGVTDVAMSVPAANIAQAYAIWKSQGYTAWSTY